MPRLGGKGYEFVGWRSKKLVHKAVFARAGMVLESMKEQANSMAIARKESVVEGAGD